MNGRRLLVAVSLALVACAALAPAVHAFGGRGGGGAGFRGRPSGPPLARPAQGFKGGPSMPGGPFGPGGYNRAFPGMDGPCPGPTGCVGFNSFKGGFRGGVPWAGGASGWVPWGATTVYYGSGYDWPGAGSAPVTYYAPQFYAPTYPAAAPAVYTPSPASSISLAPAPAPAPSIVAFPGGHYELRGDGLSTPYQWVWVPNPPAGPPASPAAQPAPAATPTAEALSSPSADGTSRSSSTLYRWTDDQGTVHWTNRKDAVPSRYRNAAKYPPPA